MPTNTKDGRILMSRTTSSSLLLTTIVLGIRHGNDSRFEFAGATSGAPKYPFLREQDNDEIHIHHTTRQAKWQDRSVHFGSHQQHRTGTLKDRLLGGGNSTTDTGGKTEQVVLEECRKTYGDVSPGDGEYLWRLRNMVVLDEEGIIYCPIPKTASAEWKRALRWVLGIEDWEGAHSNLHAVGANGLTRLTDWGIEGVAAALGSERFFKFVVVRDPAERLLSAFLNKCVTDGYMSGRLKPKGAPSCLYLELIPELFPDTAEASLASHQRLRDLIEDDPEDVFYHFVLGVQREMKTTSGACNVRNRHFKPQSCFCNLPKLLPEFHVIPFANMSTEAADFTHHLPEAILPRPATHEGRNGPWEAGSGCHDDGVVEAVVGVDDARRAEIHEFLQERFDRPRDEQRKVTGAAEHKSVFLSDRVMDVIRQMYEMDYVLLGDYFLSS